MSKPTNSAALGALVREHRETAGLTQTQLAERIDASRFWVAAFEKGKPSAELGLALRAIHAVGLILQIGPDLDAPVAPTSNSKNTALPYFAHNTALGNVIARATLTKVSRSAIDGWPTTPGTKSKLTKTTARRRRNA